MKLGIISDVHANREALEAVLCCLSDANKIICAGDIVDRFYLNDAVVDLVEKHGIEFVQGNHDDGIFHNYMCQRGSLSPKNLSRVLSAPLEREYTFSGRSFLMVHGSPWNRLKEYLYPDSPKIGSLTQLEKDVIILGHTHVPMVQRVNGTTVINPGSVGQPPASDPRPTYAVMDTDTGEVRIEKVDFCVRPDQLRTVRPETGL